MFELHWCENIYASVKITIQVQNFKLDQLLRYLIGRQPNVCPAHSVSYSKIRSKSYILGHKLRNYNMQTKTF